LRLSSLIPRAALILLLTYMVAVGATFNGILTPGLRLQGVLVLAIGVALWLFARWRKQGASWHRTALDFAILLWIAAFAISLMANAEVWRRIAMGLWFMGVYLGAWYALHDALANRLIQRDMLADTLLFAGLIVILIGYTQVQGWIRDTLPLIAAGELPFSLPRPVSTLGNPNTLAAVLVILLPFSAGRMIEASNPIQRLIMGMYSIAAGVLLIATYSRGGWVGGAAGLGALALWMLAQRNLLSPSRWRDWLLARKPIVRFGVFVATAVVLVGLIAGVIFFVGSFSIGGRTLDLRTFIYDTALTMFAEKPLAGHGLFTFGGGLARLNSTPPTEAHSHAHSIPLQVAAELGIIGLAALALTLWEIFRGIRANFREIQPPVGARHAVPLLTSTQTRTERLTLISATAAFIGFGVHHLLDLPAMSPAVMAMALVALIAAAAPIIPKELSRSTSRAVMALMAGGWAALLISGVWSSLIYQQYVSALSYGLSTQDYAGAAERLEPVIAVDPEMAVYHQQRGFLLGLAAAAGDLNSLQEAIAEFERYTTLAPEYSTGWANLGALYAQVGNYERAAAAMRRAVELAPSAPTLADRLAEYQIAAETGAPMEAWQPIPTPISTETDAEFLPNINYIQWLRLAIQRQFLPQVRYGE
jgi:tetratricopeptide (TPR) repeat protein/multisubunit Na+/H+ antiporter MnhB subunit